MDEPVKPAKPARFPASLSSLNNTKVPAPRPAQVLRPQLHLHQSARDARLARTPQGVGLDSERLRFRMVERLRADGIACESVLRAMGSVPRHEFVDTALVNQAYEDTSLPIGHGQTISKPSVVARMLEWLHAHPTVASRGHLGRVLEIGTGCGYQTAVLAALGTFVVSVERLKPLHDIARVNLEVHRANKVRLVYGDGMLGHPPNAPYDVIISAAGGLGPPQAWLDQLAVGGRLVAPSSAMDGGAQQLVIVDRLEEGYRRTVGETVQFVPLKSGIG